MRPQMDWFALGAILCCLAGCNSSPASPNSGRHNPAANGVAVVDLDAVAKRLGKDVEIAKSLDQKQTTLKERVDAIQESAVSQLRELKKKMGEKPSDKQQQEFRTLQQDLN